MKRYIKIFILVFSLSFLWGCLEDSEVYKVTVKTDSIVEFVQGGVSVSGGIYTENEEYHPTIESSGFCYGLAEGPTLSNFVVKVKKSGIGDFNATLKSLDEDTKYYVRAFAQNKYGVVYGEEVSFVSLIRPSVQTLSVLDDNRKFQMVVECELESLGSGDVSELGVCYSSEKKLPNKDNDEYKLVSNIQKGKYTVSIPVEPNVKYYVRALASNLAGVAYGEVKEILTTEAIYTIKFDGNGGVGSMEEIYTTPSKEVQLISNSFTRTGYTFIGWNTEVDGSGTTYYNEQNISIDSDLILYAQWASLYTITFNANGGTGSMSSKTLSVGSSITLPSNTFTRSGYEFVGWNTNSYGTGASYTDGQTITPLGNISLYAQWKKIEIYYTISFNSNGGSGNMGSKTVSTGSSVTLPNSTFTRYGYEFVGWNTNADGSGVPYTNGQRITPSRNITLYAQWKKIEEDQEQVSGSHMSHDYVDLGLPSGTLWATCNVGTSKPEEYGDYFAWGENTTKSKYNSSTYTFSSKKDIANANWGGNWRMPTKDEKDELRDPSYTTWTWTTHNGVEGYRVTSNVNDNSIFLPAAGYRYSSELYEEGSYGYYWSRSLDTSDSEKAYCLYFNNSEQAYSYFSFRRYYGIPVRPILSGSYVKPDQPTLYTITFKANGGSGSMSSMTVNASSSITLPSNKFTQSGYSFTGWNTEADGSGVSYANGQSLTISGNLTLYAQWRIYVSTITLNANDGSGESSSIDVSRSEKVILLNKFVRGGYVFLNWNTEADGSGLSYENAEEIMVAGDLILYAQWRKYDTPKVTTSNVTDITNNSASCGGSIISLDYEIIERGICYSSSSTPTISDYAIKSGTGVGAFTCSLTALSSGTTYYVRAYAKYADDKVIYGETRSFTTQRIPVISSFTISNIGETSADCNAYVNSYDYTITERGFCYSTYSNPTINDYKVSSSSGNGTYTGILSSLNRNTTYYVRAYAVYNGNIIYSDVKSFKTFYTLKITTLEVTDITEDYVVLEGEIICPGVTISKRGFDYWTSTNPKVNTISCASGEGEFGIKWEFFMANTTYYVRAYAIIDGIKSYGNTQMFNTLPTNIDYPNGSKLYFINTAGWENVYAYVWKERGISSGTSGVDLGVIPWPGKPATYEGTFRGNQIYSYDIVGLDVNSIIFSQYGGSKTYDLEIDLYNTYYYLGEWYESINDIP